MPSGKVDKPIIQDNRDGTVSVKYDPKEEGSHELIVKYNGEPVQGKFQLWQSYRIIIDCFIKVICIRNKSSLCWLNIIYRKSHSNAFDNKLFLNSYITVSLNFILSVYCPKIPSPFRLRGYIHL